MLGTRLREILCSKKMTIAEVAEMSDLPLETVRNIYYGKTTDPKISTVLQLSKALDMSVNCLMGQCSHSKEERAILTHYRMCGNHGKSLIGLVAKYEALTAKAERDCVEKHKIPCLITRGDIHDGIVYDACETMEIETTMKNVFVAIQVGTNDLVPAFCKGDIILLADRFPSHGELAVFCKDGRTYIRQFQEEEKQYRLHCIHRRVEDIILKRMDEIEVVGSCVGVIRT